MIKVFVDSDVIIDLLAKRAMFYDDAVKIFKLAEKRELQLYSTGLSFANVFYILRKIFGNRDSLAKVKLLRQLVSIVPLNQEVVDEALSSQFVDFEDALQFFSSKFCDIPVFVTRNIRDFDGTEPSVKTPKQFLISLT
jgi:predicted nucleic acid-binding protein